MRVAGGAHNLIELLGDFLDVPGIQTLLVNLSIGPILKKQGQGPHCSMKDMDEFVDFFRRVQTPYYEEARRLFSNPSLLERYAGANEGLPYMEAQLKHMIETFG